MIDRKRVALVRESLQRAAASADGRRMTRRRRWPSLALLWCGGLLATAVAGCDATVGPLIEAVVPGAAAPGEHVDVVGERFAGDQRFVSCGGEVAAVELWQARRVRIIVPELPPQPSLVIVTVDGRPSNVAELVIRPPR